MKRLKLKLWHKTVLALATIGLITGATVASMYAYAINSDEVKGLNSPVSQTLFSNDFSKIFNKDGKVQSEQSILDPLKTTKVANVLKDGKAFSWVGSNEEMTFDVFFKEYHKKYNENFIQQVTYGSFNFYNEYVLAVRPDKFLDFTQWFISNVAWGPDLITLESFRLVPGVQTSGNSIILGSHSTLQKEESEIKFYPDAFFGSMPLYSEAGGPGNATDALTNSTFGKLQDKKNTDDFLKSIPFISARLNSQTQRLNPFKDIFLPHKLVNKTVLVSNQPFNDNERIILKDMTKAQFDDYVNKNFSSDDLEKNKLIYNNFTKYNIDALETKLETLPQGSTKARANILEFSLSRQNNKNQKLTISLSADNTVGNTTFLTFGSLREYSEEDLLHFLDFYDLNSHLKKKFFLYENSNKKRSFFSSRIQGINEINGTVIPAQIQEWEIELFRVVDGKLHVSLTGKNDDKSTRTREIIFESKNMTAEKLKDFLDFKNVLNYQGSIKPVVLVSSPEDLTIQPPEGQTFTTLDRVKYQVYTEVYPNLLELVSLKYPELLKTSTGPHVVQELNDQGYYEYVVKNGEYKQFGINDRVGLPLLLHATDDNFEGISIDFLKYVAAHEYGHHITLEKTQAIDEKDAGVIVNALSSNSGVRVGSYYNFKYLENYLKARTNLEIERVNTLGQVSPTGSFIKFTFIKEDGTKEVETYEDIWGAKEGDDDIFSVLNNPRRRFLQDFEGLKEAAKIRNIKLGDLFLANSIDHNSGTINPLITGPNQTFSKNEKGEKIFKPVNKIELLKQMTDGAGNKLTFENIDGNQIIKVYEATEKRNKDNQITNLTISKVLIKNPDGSDAIKVPLNVELNESDTKYVLDKRLEIIRNFESLVITESFDNGWNDSNTNFAKRVNISNREYFAGFAHPTPPKHYKSQILLRGSQRELDPKYNIVTKDNIDKPQTDGRNLNVFENDTLAKQIFTLLNSAITDSYNVPGDVSNIRWFNKNTILNFVSTTNVDGKSLLTSGDSYLISDNQTSGETAFVKHIAYESDPYGAFNVDAVRTLNSIIPRNPRLNLSSTSGKIALDIGRIFAAFFSQDPRFTLTDGSDLNGKWRGFVQLLNDKNLPIKSIDPRGTSNYMFPVTPDTKSDNQEIFKITQGRTSANLVVGSIKKIAIDMANVLFVPVNKLFKNAFNKKYILQAGSAKYLAFEKLQDFINFVSIDYSKVIRRLVKTKEGENEVEKNQYNWDIEYVKTKFDFDKYKNGSLEDKLLSDQEIANKLMALFSKSLLNMLTKNFSIEAGLINNWALFSKEYGIEFFDEKFSKNFTENETETFPQHNVKILLDGIKAWAESQDNTNKEAIFKKLDLGDLLHFIGNRIWFEGSTFPHNAVIPLFSPRGEVSSDILDLNSTRIKDRLNDIFTDYVYSLSETLTRDYVQTTYVPISDSFSNLPSYIGNVNEANTGIDYTIDAKSLDRWNRNVKLSQNTFNLALQYFNSKIYKQLAIETDKIRKEYKPKIDEVDKKLEELEKKHKSSVISEARYTAQKKLLNDKKIKITTERNKKISDFKTSIGGDLVDPISYVQISFRSSSYFGKLQIKANGYFKDRFQKKTIAMELYDDNLNEVIDKSIRLKDFEGNAITSVPKAFFISQLYNYGVSKRNLSGIFRNKKLDALSLYGYVKNEVASKIKKLRFTDLETGEAKYLDVNTNSTNNLFYFTKQGDPNSKVTLHDLGYSSWISNYALMGKYRDTLLNPDSKYYIELVDENNKVIEEVSIGDLQTLSENGKDPAQSPIFIKKQNVKDSATNIEKERTVLSIDLQFNIQR